MSLYHWLIRKSIILSWKRSSEQKYSELGEIETDRLIQHGKKIGIDEILKQNER